MLPYAASPSPQPNATPHDRGRKEERNQRTHGKTPDERMTRVGGSWNCSVYSVVLCCTALCCIVVVCREWRAYEEEGVVGVGGLRLEGSKAC